MSFVSVDEYIDSLEEDAKIDIVGFVNYMNIEFPRVVPKISFSMPMWWIGSKMYDGYVAVSAAKKHYSVHFYDENYISRLKELLPGCSFGKRCINIKYGDESAITIVKQIVKQYLNSIL